MAQAVEAHTTSRRSFLAAAAVAGAIVAPNVAAAAAPHPDAELIRLGQQHDELVQKLKVATIKLEPLWAEHRRRMDEWKAANPQGIGIDAYERLWDEVGLTEANKTYDADAITDEMDPVSRKIMAIPAMTIAGLLVKARVAKYNAREFWDESYEDADWVHLQMRELCDAVIDMAARTAAQIAAS